MSRPVHCSLLAQVAKKLQQLGALTKGDRRAADASDLSQFDVDTPYGRKALLKVVEMLLQPGVSSQRPPDAYVREAIGLHANSELQGKWAEYLDAAEDALANAGIDDEASTTRFLNRILGMPVKLQNMIFSHFSAELDEQIKIAKVRARLPHAHTRTHTTRTHTTQAAAPRTGTSMRSC